jgi:hypothetical protein
MKSRLIMALACYAMLAILAAVTLQGTFRIVVWIFLAGLAAKTLIAAKMQKTD